MDLRFKMLLTSLVAGLVAIQMDSPRAFHKQCYPTGATLSPKVWAVTCCDFEPTSDTTLGRKLRTLEYFDGNREVDSSGTLWSRPPYPLRMFQAYKRENARPPTKMTSVVLNGPHTTGYSVCLDSRDMSLHVHKTDGPFSLCASPELRRPSGRWLYMPIAGDEWVSEVWLPSDSFQRSTLIVCLWISRPRPKTNSRLANYKHEAGFSYGRTPT
ncbi:hypothetical protein J3458_003699 [Metarhizium acridum]|uniref:uncharacterized protein n=1 Tax=Metarhizium acridum TaxID=92637 RepID=UPI001C6C6EBD|nr:hypothetical protein J3458_003699 [Metarhizium acridum]